MVFTHHSIWMSPTQFEHASVVHQICACHLEDRKTSSLLDSVVLLNFSKPSTWSWQWTLFSVIKLNFSLYFWCIFELIINRIDDMSSITNIFWYIHMDYMFHIFHTSLCFQLISQDWSSWIGNYQETLNVSQAWRSYIFHIVGFYININLFVLTFLSLNVYFKAIWPISCKMKWLS